MSKDPRLEAQLHMTTHPLTCKYISPIAVHLRLLRPLCHPSHLPPTLLLAASGLDQEKRLFTKSGAESGHRPRALPECPLPGRQQDVGHQLCVSLGGEEGVDQRGTYLSVEADV